MAITTVEVRVSAGHPNMPLRPVAAFAGSAVTVGVIDVPKRRCGVDVTSVSVSIENADGTVDTEPAKLVGCAWCATFPSDYFATPGFVQNGLTVTVGGKDENGVARAWTVGRGDFEVLSADAVPQPGESWQNVHYRAEVPDDPVVGDLAKVEGEWKLYTEQGWQTLGGGSGGAVESVNGQTGAVVLTGADIATSADDERTVAETLAEKADEFTPWLFDGDVGDWSIVFHNEEPEAAPPGGVWFADLLNGGELVHSVVVENQFVTSVSFRWGEDGMVDATRRRVLRTGDADKLTPEQKAVLAGGPYATEDQLRVTMQLVGNDPYTVQLNGETLTFAQIKELSQTRNAVIQRGQGTYRVTYIGATEMMWDVTGSVAGKVQTGQIHIFDQSGVTVVQRVEPKTLATEGEVHAAQTAADGALGFSAYPIKAVVNGQLLDRTVNTSTGGAFTFPTSGTGARDFVVVVAASSTAPSVSFPSSGVSYFSDDDAVWTAEADKVNVWYFTEIAANQFMVAHKALAQTTQA